MSTSLVARKPKRYPRTVAIAKAILEQYNCKNVEDMQDAIKDIFGPMFETMLQGKMDSHLGYESNDHVSKSTENRRNGYNSKTLKSTCGDIPVEVPCDRSDCLYVSGRKEMETKNLAVYVILGYDVNGVKDILGLGSAKRRGNITGCRSLMRSKPAVWRMCCSSVKEKNASDRTYRTIIKRINNNGYVIIDQTGQERIVPCGIPNVELRPMQSVYVKEPMGRLKELHICGVVENKK